MTDTSNATMTFGGKQKINRTTQRELIYVIKKSTLIETIYQTHPQEGT